MSLLTEYLHALFPEERQRLRTLHLSVREKDVLEILTDYDEGLHEQQRTVLGISSAHWDKIQSILIRKLYEAFVPTGAEKLIHHLASRYTLTKHVMKELQYQQRTLVPDFNAERKATYYRILLDTFLGMPIHSSNERLLIKLLRNYLSALPTSQRASQKSLYQSQIRSERISIMASQMRLQKGREDTKLERELLREYKNSCLCTSKIAQVFADLALYDYYAAIESDSQLYHISRAKKVSDTINDINSGKKQQIHTKLATTLYQQSSDFEGAYREYDSLFRLFPEAVNNIYPVAKYIQVCLILSRMPEAKRMLDRTFKKLLMHEKHVVAGVAALNYAKYYTMTHDYDLALVTIQKGMRLLKKQLYVQYEIELRNLQTAILVLRNDSESALAAIDRNLRFLRDKGFKSSNSDLGEFYVVLRQYLLQPEKVQTDQSTQRILEKWSHGIYNIYGALLKSIVRVEMPMRTP